MAASRVGGSSYGTNINGGADASPLITVALGDVYLVGTICYNGAGAVRPTLSKAAGTATIGTPVARHSIAAVSGLGTQLEAVIWEVPVTAAGTCSIGISTTGNQNSAWGLVAVRGLPTTAIVKPVGATGTGTVYSTPAIVAPSGTTTGFIVGLFTDDTGNNLTYTLSDTQDWQFHDGSSDVTGAQNGKVVTGAGSNVLTNTSSASQNWQALAVGYFDSAGSSDVDVALGAGAAVAASAAITVATTNDVRVSLGVGAVVAAGLAPSISTTADQFIALGKGSAVATGLAPSVDPGLTEFYQTDFSGTEDPLSEGGSWLLGQTDGTQWGDFKTTGGNAVGKRAKDVADNTALLKGVWPADQYATAVCYAGSPSDTYYPEIELRLRSAIATNVNRGYEIGFSARSTGAYLIVVRWNGAYDDYTYIRLYNDDAYRVVDGDVIRAEIRGSALRVYKNGVLLLPDGGADTVADMTKDGAGASVGALWPDGAPGFGTNTQSGGDAFVDQVGVKSFEAGAIGPISVALGVGSAVAAGLAPTISVTNDQFVSVGAGAAQAAAAATTVVVSNDVHVSLGVGVASATGQATTIGVTADVVVSLGVGAAQGTGLAPAIAVTHDQFVSLGVGAAAAAGNAPTVHSTADVFVAIGVGQAVAAGLNLSIDGSADVFVDVGVGGAIATGLAVSPHASADVSVALGVGTAVAAGVAPSLHITADVFVAIATGAALTAGLPITVLASVDVVIAIGVGAALAAGFRPTITGIVTLFIGSAGRLVLLPDDGRLSLSPDDGRLSLIPDGMTTTDPTQTRKAGDALILGGVLTGQIPEAIDWAGVAGTLHIVTNTDVQTLERSVPCTITPPSGDTLPRYDYIGGPIVEGDYLYEIEIAFAGLDDPLTWPNDKTKFKLKVIPQLS